MLNRSTGLKRSTELRARTPMPRVRKAKREKGLGQRVEATLGFLRPLGTKAPTALRSEEHRRNVAALACVACGRSGPSQCAHPNYGRGMSQKACDSVTFPLCADAFGVRGCHTKHDSGGMSRAERRRLEWHYADTTRAELLRFNNWSASVEAHYQKAIEGLKQVAE